MGQLLLGKCFSDGGLLSYVGVPLVECAVRMSNDTYRIYRYRSQLFVYAIIALWKNVKSLVTARVVKVWNYGLGAAF